MRNMIMVGKFFGLKSLFLVFTFIFGAAFSFTAFGAGELDSTFTASAYGGTNGNIFVIRQQSDGKILVGGQFTEINGFAATGIGRLNADGSVDTSFFPPDFYNGSGIGATIYAIAVQPDGKILVGGFIRGVNDAKIGIRRLNADGSLDSSFFIVEFNQAIAAWTAYDIKLQSDGKILVGGWFGFISPEDRRSLIRLNTDGTFDNTFTQPNVADIREFQILPDGKIIAVGLNNPGSGGQNQPFLRKFNADGTTDTSFTPITSGNGLIEAVKVLPNGQFLVGGSFSILNGFVQGGISRINADGTMDLNFNLNNPGANGAVKDIAVKPDGKIIIAGAFSTYNSVAKQTVTGLNQDGT
nr:hypothetical protein [Pyrinomonadaceae bacterium]